MMLAVAPDLPKQIKDLMFNIERSIRYHSRRQAFFEMFDAVVNTSNLILGSGAVLALISDRVENWVLGILSAIVAIVSFVNLTMRSAERSALHSQLKQRFMGLLKRIKRLDHNASDCAALLRKCEEKRLDIEREEPPIYRMVDILAHNEQCRAQGEKDDCIYYVHPLKVLTANLWRYETDDLKTVEQVAKEKAKL